MGFVSRQLSMVIKWRLSGSTSIFDVEKDLGCHSVVDEIEIVPSSVGIVIRSSGVRSGLINGMDVKRKKVTASSQPVVGIVRCLYA